MSETLLSVAGCGFRYGDGNFELRDIAVDMRRGEVVGIVGPNGSGKSTLLRLMSGLLRPAAGRVELEGAPVGSYGRRRLATRLAFLPQSPEASFAFTVRQVVAMGRYPYQRGLGFLSDEDVAVVEEALAQTDSEHLAGRRFTTLSGGEKQRVLVASILAQRPAVMLLDEPAGALDIHHRADLFDLLWGLSRTGIAVVLVTHNLNAASQFCDRLLLLSQGRLVRGGAPADVMDEELLSEVYGAEVRVVRNPVTGTPMAIVLGKTAHETG